MKKLLLLLFIFPALGLQSQKWEKNYDFVDQCICGLSKVGKAGKIGYVDKQGNEIIKLEYTIELAILECVITWIVDTNHSTIGRSKKFNPIKLRPVACTVKYQ